MRYINRLFTYFYLLIQNVNVDPDLGHFLWSLLMAQN